MTIVKFRGYGRSEDKYVNIDKIVMFDHINLNGEHGTELQMDDGSSIRVGHWPETVQQMIEATKRQGGAE